MKDHNMSWSLIIITLVIAAWCVTFGGLFPALRPAVVALFIVLCPGITFIRFFSFHDTQTDIILGVALSLAIHGLVATLMLYIGWWQPYYAIALIMIISVCGAFVQLPHWSKQASQ